MTSNRCRCPQRIAHPRNQSSQSCLCCSQQSSPTDCITGAPPHNHLELVEIPEARASSSCKASRVGESIPSTKVFVNDLTLRYTTHPIHNPRPCCPGVPSPSLLWPWLARWLARQLASLPAHTPYRQDIGELHSGCIPPHSRVAMLLSARLDTCFGLPSLLMNDPSQHAPSSSVAHIQKGTEPEPEPIVPPISLRNATFFL